MKHQSNTKGIEKIKFNKWEESEEILLATRGFWFHDCCDCHLGHTWFLEVIRGKKKDNDSIRIIGSLDRVRTQLRRNYEDNLNSLKNK